MGFFQDLKNDLSAAVDELINDEEKIADTKEVVDVKEAAETREEEKGEDLERETQEILEDIERMIQSMDPGEKTAADESAAADKSAAADESAAADSSEEEEDRSAKTVETETDTFEERPETAETAKKAESLKEIGNSVQEDTFEVADSSMGAENSRETDTPKTAESLKETGNSTMEETSKEADGSDFRDAADADLSGDKNPGLEQDKDKNIDNNTEQNEDKEQGSDVKKANDAAGDDTAEDGKEAEMADEEKKVNEANEANEAEEMKIDRGSLADEIDNRGRKKPGKEKGYICPGMTVEGNIRSEGGIQVDGRVIGHIDIVGELYVTGYIKGNAKANEIIADGARIQGDIMATDSVKLGNKSVVMGNIYGMNAVIEGAVKGDIDIHGPVTIDASAIIKGNIKSRSVQISDGAVIDGMCIQAYAPVTPSEFFKEVEKEIEEANAKEGDVKEEEEE